MPLYWPIKRNESVEDQVMFNEIAQIVIRELLLSGGEDLVGREIFAIVVDYDGRNK